MAYVSFKTGEKEKASQLLSYALKAACRMNSEVAESFALMAEAYFALERGLEAQCIETLRKGFCVMRKESFMHFLF